MPSFEATTIGLDLGEIHQLFDSSVTCDDDRSDANMDLGNPNDQVRHLQYSLEEQMHRLKDELTMVRVLCSEDVQALRSRLDSLEASMESNAGGQEEHVLQDTVSGDRARNPAEGPEGRSGVECGAEFSREEVPPIDYACAIEGSNFLLRGANEADSCNPPTLGESEPHSQRRGTPTSDCATRLRPELRMSMSALERQIHGMPMTFLERETKERYRFGASTWDIAGLVGVNAVGVGSSIVATIVILVKIFMQLIFIGIAYFNFRTPPINQDVLNAAKAWRTNVGHQAMHLDTESGHSLVGRVCAGDMSLEKSGSQIDLYKNVGDYLKPDASGVEALFDGQALCLVALACWYLMVSKEIHDALNWFRALLTLPRSSKDTTIVPLERPGFLSTYKFKNMNSWRLRCCLFVLIYRLLVATALLYCGTKFLVYTIEVTELILNAVALEIILNIDELMFESLTTSAMRHLVHRLEPIDMARWPHWKGVDAKACLMNLVLPLSLGIVYATGLAPMVAELQAVADALCGGSRNFVWVEDTLQMVWMAPTKAYTDSFQSSSSVKVKAVLEAVGQVQPESRANSRYAMWKNDTKSLELQGKYRFSQALEKLQPSCQDFPPGPALNYIRDLVNVTIDSCRDVQPWCTSVSVLPDRKPDNGKGILARALCPMTCGCANPSSSIFVTTGCPTYCTSHLNPAHVRFKSQASCTQKTPAQLRNSTMWMSWVSQIRSYAAGADDTGDTNVAIQVAKLMEESGCEADLAPLYLYPCWEWLGQGSTPHNFPFRLWGNICPRTCFCVGRMQNGRIEKAPLCPPNCSGLVVPKSNPFR